MIRSMHLSHARLLAAAAALALAASALGGLSASATAAARAPAASATVQWTPCRDGFDCATVRVPLDYDRPSAGSVSLALIRLPAGNPRHRIGSLFVNPGGPGGSGVDFVRGVGKFFPLELRGAFDIVGFDPRGVMRSNPLRCFDTFDEALAVLAPFPFPVTTTEERSWQASDRALADACARRGDAIRDHMSTANVARDLDQLRRAVGDQRLNYLGYSYGSYLGVTYANLFPDRIRALVVDGVVDPIAWSAGHGSQARTLPFSTRVRSDDGSLRTLREFLRLCDRAGPNCAFSGNAERRYDRLAQRLLKEPLRSKDGFVYTYADLVVSTLGVLYAPFIWPDYAAFLADLDAAASAATLRQRMAAVRNGLGVTTAAQEAYPNLLESFPGVGCSDSVNPRLYAAWPRAAEAEDARFRYFGRPWTWMSSICQPWPGRDADRYLGPWSARTSSPVLVVGNYFDPATRYQGAVTVSKLLPNSRLLSYAGWGHVAFLAAGNFCVDSAVTRYLVRERLPQRGTVCAPEGSPFGPLQKSASARAKAPAELHAALLPEPVRRSMR